NVQSEVDELKTELSDEDRIRSEVEKLLAEEKRKNAEIEKMGRLDATLGHYFATCCNHVLQQLDNTCIRAIGLHGQTIRHRPTQDDESFTLQIGDANRVCEITGTDTVADFRRRDIAAGGQGAPLVPAFHRDLFSAANIDRVIVNIGGMANITLLAHKSERPLSGFDTGPGNVLLDAWIRKCKGLNYDDAGLWAASGEVSTPLLTSLLKLDYYDLPAPKSTGREQFNLDWLESRLSTLPTLAEQDVQRTLLELTAITIAREINKLDLEAAEVYTCGGGSHNPLLLERIQAHLAKDTSVETTQALGLHPDWVEATAFAWLAKRTLEGLSGNCSSVTGAKGERILGAIYQS
ncbi:MAG: anhydro-N-acetylmuramic acid kinase, partial [Pseudomonadales bacterium]